MKNLPPSWGLRFKIRAPGYSELDTGYLKLDEDAVHQEQTFRLGPGGIITGRVVDSSAAPLSEIPVVLSGLDLERAFRPTDLVQAVKTDQGGRFRLEGVTPGRTRLIVRPARHLAELTTTASVEHDTTADLGDLLLSTGARMSGQVVPDAGGTPMAGVRVTLDGDPWGAPDRENAMTPQSGWLCGLNSRD